MKRLKDFTLHIYHFSNSWVGTIIIVLVAIFFFAQAFVIPSGSMKNTFHEGDYLIVKKYVYGVPIPHIPWLEIPILPDFNNNGHLINGKRPERGDVVVFRYPENPKMHYVKRCVAIGGDSVMLRGDTLYIHYGEGNEYMREKFSDDLITLWGHELWVKDPFRDDHKGIRYDAIARESGILPMETSIFGPITVPEDRFFMMGDNRDHSNDSRFWGSVPYEYIVGQPWFVYFSWEPRSFDEMTRRGVFLSDYEALRAVCGDGEFTTDQCREKWGKEHYKVRWNRIGKSVDQLEEGL